MKNFQNDCLLTCVEEQEIEARKFGFYWQNVEQLLEQIRSECVEVKEAWQRNDRSHLQEEIGDLMQAAVSLAVFCDLDPRETLHNGIKKFQKRYDKVVELAKKDGHTGLHNHSFEDLMKYWNLAKLET